MTTLARQKHPRIGTVLAGLQIEAVLGSGGFGITYRARELRTGCYYALKEFFPSELATLLSDGRVVSAASPRAEALFAVCRQNFAEEAELLRALPYHPSLVQIRGLVEKYGTFFTVMEVIDGEPLSRVIDRLKANHQTIHPADMCRIACALCDALSLLHGQRLIHADIKPDNIMIRNQDFSPVLIDFGAARTMMAGDTRPSMLTQRYAAIEQLFSDLERKREGLRLGPWTDLYALSLSIYRAMCAIPAASSSQRLHALSNSLPDPYQPVLQHAPNLPQGFASVIDLGCALLPQDRPADANAFAKLLESSLTEIPPAESMTSLELTQHVAFGTAPAISNLSHLGRVMQQDDMSPPSQPRSDQPSPALKSKSQTHGSTPKGPVPITVLALFAVALVALVLLLNLTMTEPLQ